MKNLFFVIILLSSFSVAAQKHTETIKKELQFAQADAENFLTVNNINGSITVEGYSGNTILLEVEKTLTASNERKLEQGKTEIELGIHEAENDIIIYLKTPCSNVQSKKSRNGKMNWQTWKNNCNWQSDVDFNLEIKIKVPYATNLAVSTVNDGDIAVEKMAGEVDANNVNGSISLQEISGKTHAHTINGEVDITYTKNPSEDSRYYSLNGDVNVFYKKGLSAQLAFESYNGDFFTNLDDVEMLPTVLEKKKIGKGVKYKVGGKSKMQVGNGKVLLDFETFNGNVYVKER